MTDRLRFDHGGMEDGSTTLLFEPGLVPRVDFKNITF